MTVPPAWWRRDGDRLVLQCYVQPRSSRDHIVGVYDGALKVCLTAAPVDGKANAHLLRLLARLLRVAPGCVTLMRGETSRRKTVAVRDTDVDPTVLLGERNEL